MENKTIQNAAIWVTKKGRLYLVAERQIERGEKLWFLKNEDRTEENNRPNYISINYKEKPSAV